MTPCLAPLLACSTLMTASTNRLLFGWQWTLQGHTVSAALILAGHLSGRNCPLRPPPPLGYSQP